MPNKISRRWTISCPDRGHIRSELRRRAYHEETPTSLPRCGPSSEYSLFFDNTGAGEIAVRISNDMSLVKDGISQKVGLISFGLAGFVSAIIISFVRDWRLALVMLCIPLIIILVSWAGVGSALKRSQESASVEYAKSGTFAEEVISCIRNVTAYGSQGRFLRQYEKILVAPEAADFKRKAPLS